MNQPGTRSRADGLGATSQEGRARYVQNLEMQLRLPALIRRMGGEIQDGIEPSLSVRYQCNLYEYYDRVDEASQGRFELLISYDLRHLY